MSHIYTFEQIRQIPSDKVINQAAFETGIGITRAGFRLLVEQELMAGAFIYGSAVFKATNVCSDIDTLVAVHSFNEEIATSLQSIVEEVMKQTATSLSLTAYTVEQLKTGRHRERAGKVAWLRERVDESPELVIGSNPVDMIKARDKDYSFDVDDFLTNQVVEIAWPYIHGFDRNRESALENVLSVPHRVGRKTLDALVHAGLLNGNVIPDMRKATIANSVVGVYGSDLRVIELQQELRDDLMRYMILVEEVRGGLIGSNEYDQLITATLRCDTPKAMEFVERVQQQYRKLLGMKAISKSIFI